MGREDLSGPPVGGGAHLKLADDTLRQEGIQLHNLVAVSTNYEEFERLHNLRIEAAELAIEGLKDTDFIEMSEELLDLLYEIENDDLDYDEREDKMEDFQDKWEDEIDEMEDQFDEYEDEISDIRGDIRDEEQDLHPDDYDLLADEGCI